MKIRNKNTGAIISSPTLKFVHNNNSVDDYYDYWFDEKTFEDQQFGKWDGWEEIEDENDFIEKIADKKAKVWSKGIEEKLGRRKNELSTIIEESYRLGFIDGYKLM